MLSSTAPPRLNWPTDVVCGVRHEGVTRGGAGLRLRRVATQASGACLHGSKGVLSWGMGLGMQNGRMGGCSNLVYQGIFASLCDG